MAQVSGKFHSRVKISTFINLVNFTQNAQLFENWQFERSLQLVNQYFLGSLNTVIYLMMPTIKNTDIYAVILLVR